jgi:hypothetical protein
MKLHMPAMRRWPVVVTIGAIGAGAGSVALATGVPSDPVGPFEPDQRPVVSAVQGDQRGGFAAFARTRTAADQVPTKVREQIGNSTVSGRNLDLSRAVSTTTGKGWAVPGNGTVCLVVPDPPVGYGVTCLDTGVALKQGLVAMLVTPTRPIKAELTMLAPQGSHVRATMNDGSARTLGADNDGVVSATLPGAREVSVETQSGTHRVAIPASLPTQASGIDCDGRPVSISDRCPTP